MAAFHFQPYDGGAFNYAEKINVECSQSGFSNVWIKPQNGTTNQAGPFIFDIDPSVDKYIMLKKVMLETDCRVVRSDGTDLQWEDIVAPVDLFGATMWESVEVFLNGQPFSGASAVNAGYKAFIQTMLTYDADSAASHLQSQFFYQDTPGYYDTFFVTRDTVRDYFRKLAEEGHFPGIVVPLKYRAEEKTYTNDELKADENRIRGLKGEAAVGDDWTPPDADKNLTDTGKYLGRLQTYDDHFERELTDATKALLIDPAKDRYNVGFNARAVVARGSAKFDTYSPLCHDFFKVDNNLGPGNRLQVKLTRHKDPFLLNSYLNNKGYKVVIDDMRLHLHYVQRRERIRPPLREVYRMNETQLHKQLVNATAPSITFRVHNGGVLPKTIVFAMVTVNQAEGAYNANPFHLHHFFQKNISLNINGEQYPMSGLETDFDRVNPKIARTFYWGFDNTGAADAQKGNLVSWNAFMSGCTVTTFNLDFDLCNMRHLHNAQYGYIDATIQFSQVLSDPIYVLYVKVFPKVVVNDKLSNTLSVLDIEA